VTQPFRRVPRSSLLRGTAVVVITGAISLAAACSDEDLVDTIPPPRPQHTMTDDGPIVGPPSGIKTTETPATSTGTSTSTSTAP
jgi:hypothetical protein